MVSWMLNDHGVQQGDPAGPFFYACAMAEMEAALLAAFPDSILSGYLDDLTVALQVARVGRLVD